MLRMINVDFVAAKDKWRCEYFDAEDLRNEKFFDKREEAYECLKEVVNTVQIISVLDIQLEVNSKVMLRDDKKLVDVDQMMLEFNGGFENVTNESFDFLFQQVNLASLSCLLVKMRELRNDQFNLTDKLFELEKTTLKLRSFYVDAVINDQQMLGIRTDNATLCNCLEITSTGFVQFIQRAMKSRPFSLSFSFDQVSHELQMFLFGESYHLRGQKNVQLVLNMPRSHKKLIFRFYTGTPAAGYDKNKTSILVFVSGMIASEHEAYHENVELLKTYPKLQNFLSVIGEAVPSGFSLLSELVED